MSFTCPFCCFAAASGEACGGAGALVPVIMAAAQRAASVSGGSCAAASESGHASALLLAALPPVALLQMGALEDLDLRGNPVTGLVGYKPMLAALLPHMGLQRLDGAQVTRSMA